MNLLQKSRAKLMINQPFFATLLMNMDCIEDKSIPTMATDGSRILYNPDFVAGPTMGTVGKVMFGLCHEVLHPGLLWFQRLAGKDPMLWNIAHDFKVNQIIDECIQADTSSGTKMELIEGCCRDKKYDHMSAEQIYEDLVKQRDKARKNGGSGKPGEDGMPGFDDMHGPDGDLISPQSSEGSAAAQAEATRKVAQRFAQAANVARMAGKLPGGLERFVNELIDPQVKWQDLLRDFATEQAKDDETWARRNRRFNQVYLPTRWSERMGEIVTIGDSSGSIGNRELAQYAGESGEICETMHPERLRFVWCDAVVAGEQVFEDGEFDPKQLKPMGGGGTDMRVALKYVEQYEPVVVVLFTDGYTPWPDRPTDYPLIVCCTTDAACPDWAQVVRVK